MLVMERTSFIPKQFVEFLGKQDDELERITLKIKEHRREYIQHYRPDALMLDYISYSSECGSSPSNEASDSMYQVGEDENKWLSPLTNYSKVANSFQYKHHNYKDISEENNNNQPSISEPSLDDLPQQLLPIEATEEICIDSELENGNAHQKGTPTASVDLSSLLDQLDFSLVADNFKIRSKSTTLTRTQSIQQNNTSLCLDSPVDTRINSSLSSQPKKLCRDLSETDKNTIFEEGLKVVEDYPEETQNSRIPIPYNKPQMTLKEKRLKRMQKLRVATKIQAITRGWLCRKNKIGAIHAAIASLLRSRRCRKHDLKTIWNSWVLYHLRRQRMRKRISFRLSISVTSHGEHLWYRKYINNDSYRDLTSEWGKNEVSNQYLTSRRKAVTFAKWMKNVLK